MKRGFVFLCVFFSLVSVALAAQTEIPKIKFDDRQWKIGYENSQSGDKIVEFVLDGQSVEDWTELLTVQSMPGLQSKTTAEIFAATIKKHILSICPEAQWIDIQTTPKDIIYIWSVRKCVQADDQTEIARVVEGTQALHIFHYAVKAAEISPVNRDAWIGRLKESQVILSEDKP